MLTSGGQDALTEFGCAGRKKVLCVFGILVMDAKGELVVPVEQARLLATTIPNARLVLLEGRNHILSETEPAWPRFLQEVETFLAE